MTAAPWLWIVFTLVAAGAQTVRNAAQKSLTGPLGAAGATHVRFLFGLPFSLLFFPVALALTGDPVPRPPLEFWPWVIFGALSQVGATALMLAAMNARSFVVVYAWIKTEPVQVALFGLLLLGDRLSPPMMAAILIATMGVVVLSFKPGQAKWDTRAALTGLASGALFGLAAIGFRGAILTLPGADYLTAAAFTGVFALGVPTILVSAWLAVRNPAVLAAIVRMWRPSLLAGFLGAFASQFWFMAFALATAASVRTLGLIEVLFAQILSHLAFRQRTTWGEAAGILLIVLGVGLLLAVH